jgi:uncharacterized protein (DUF305 family)
VSSSEDEPVLVDVPDDDEPARPAWSRIVIIAAAVGAVLLVGATVGMLVGRSMNDTPETPGAGSVEVGFAQDMSVHHLQAVTMAGWERDHTTDPELKQLAFDMERTQTEQVGRMKGWLMLWNQPEQTPGQYMTWMQMPMGHEHAGMSMPSSPTAGTGDAPMPGMATSTELSRLRSLSGKDLDVYFLQLMLRHHQGGVTMVQYAKDHSSLPAVQALTQSMLTSQGAEMQLMSQALAIRGAQPLPAP